MSLANNSYIVEIKEAHIMWGEYHPKGAFPFTQEIYGEGYIQIPSDVAYKFNIFNSNNPFGISARYYCTSYDSYYDGWLLAQGNQSNQFMQSNSQKRKFKRIGDWYDYVGATAGDYVKVVFTSQNHIIIEHSIDRFSFHI